MISRTIKALISAVYVMKATGREPAQRIKALLGASPCYSTVRWIGSGRTVPVTMLLPTASGKADLSYWRDVWYSALIW